MKRHRLGSGELCFDLDYTLHALRDNIARADALITAAVEPYRAAGGAS